MSLEANRRRFLALASLALTAAGGAGAHAQGAGGYSTSDPHRRPPEPPQPAPVPEGIPDDPAQMTVKDVGSWRIVSQFNHSEAFIPDDRVRLRSGGVRSFAPGGAGMHALAPGARIMNEQGEAVGTLDGEEATNERSGTEILIGGSGELKLSYAPQGRVFAGTLRLATTSNVQSGFRARIEVDGKPIRTVEVPGYVDLDVTDLFGQDLAGLRNARSLVVTVEGDDPYPIYEVDLAGTEAALEQMQLIPDYNYNVRRLGRASPQQEWEQQQNPNGAGQCFLTAACCEMVGLADDCFELAALRRFRDEVMLASASGRADVALYYDVAPAILAGIHRRGEERRLYGLYFGTILPCALMATLGLAWPTRLLYTRMMRSLAARYG